MFDGFLFSTRTYNFTHSCCTTSLSLTDKGSRRKSEIHRNEVSTTSKFPIAYVTNDTKSELVKRLTFIHHEFLDSMSATVEKYLEQSGRRFVNLGNLFSFMKL